MNEGELFFTNTLGTQQNDEEISDRDHLEPRQATLFLIDTSPPMFEENTNSQETPFMKSVQIYKNNMQMLCGFNRDDQMSLILFGTREWDKDPETKNVLTVQKFHKVTLDMLKEIKGKIDNHEGYFNLLSSDSKYPLHDALWHAAQAFSAVRTVLISRKIYLLTCEDNPTFDHPDEAHRIRTRVATFQNLGIDFRVIGLKNGFDHNKFYKELEIISSKMIPDIYIPLQLNDLEKEIQFPSRTISNIPWIFGKNVVVPVSIYTISTETRFPDMVHINRETNEQLKSSTVYRKTDEVEDDVDDVESEEQFNSNVVNAGGLAKFQAHGDRKLVFDVKELNLMFKQFNKGIETLCFKPIECDPMYHVDCAKFVTFSKTEASESQKQLFSTLVDKCEAKELMIVCRINYRMYTAPNIFYLYPNTKKGGFYIYKMAYEDHVRNLDKALSTWIYHKDWSHSPSEEAKKIFEKIVKKTRIKYDPSAFKNPKLGTLIANIEALALDMEEVDVPPDTTLPSKKLVERLADVLPEYRRIFSQNECEVPAKRRKIVDDAMILEHVQAQTVNSLTVAVLKEFLVQHNIAVSNAKKADLVSKVYQFYQN